MSNNLNFSFDHDPLATCGGPDRRGLWLACQFVKMEPKIWESSYKSPSRHTILPGATAA